MKGATMTKRQRPLFETREIYFLGTESGIFGIHYPRKSNRDGPSKSQRNP